MILGVAQGGISRQVNRSEDERTRGLFAVGITGSGKSTFFLSSALQDIREGHGLVFIDSSNTVDTLMQHIPTKKLSDVILVDPGATITHSIGINLFERKHLNMGVDVGRTMDIFKRLWRNGLHQS